MGFVYYHLDDKDVRVASEGGWREEWAELAAGWPRGQCYGKLLTDDGWRALEELMPVALRSQTDDWLLEQLADARYWQPYLTRRKPKGGFTEVDYNKRDALERLCYGEFNIAYIRGVARALLARGETHCVVYRADDAAEERGECTAWEGHEFALQAVLDGHRVRYHPPPGERAAWSVPSGPNCHHSICAVGVNLV